MYGRDRPPHRSAPLHDQRELRRNHVVCPGPGGQNNGGQNTPARPGHRPATRRAGSGERLRYRAGAAQAKAEERARRPKPGQAGRPSGAARAGAGWLSARWSPEQISRMLRAQFPDHPETDPGIPRHRARDAQTTAQHHRTSGPTPEHGHDLRAARRGRGPHRTRALGGRFDLGKAGKTAIGTLVERSTRFVLLLHLPRHHPRLHPARHDHPVAALEVATRESAISVVASCASAATSAGSGSSTPWLIVH